MRRRADRNRDFENIKSNLFNAGVSVLKAAQAHEEMFLNSLEALTEAVEMQALPAAEFDYSPENADVIQPLLDKLLAERQAALTDQDVETYLEISEKIKQLKAVSVEELELEARKLEAQLRILGATRLLEEISKPVSSDPAPRWTIETLKAEYKSLAKVREAYSVPAKTWKEAVEQVNSRS